MSSGKVRLEKTRKGQEKREIPEMVKAFELEYEKPPLEILEGRSEI